MKIAIFFPGQGSQKPGMGAEFYNSSEVFKNVFDSCDSSCKIDLKKASFEGVGLKKTSVTQPALYAVNVATYEMIKAAGIQGDIFAGLSLGEYSALASAGVIGLAQGAKLVSIRGTLMESAVPSGVASMTAVIGLSAEKISSVISGIDDVWIANMNSPAQTIIGGKLEALDIADPKIKEAGAALVKRLNVSGPFHTPLLKDAGDKLKVELDAFDFSSSKKQVYANVTGSLYSSDDDIKDILARQVSSSVHWVDIMDSVIDSCEVIIECGPGNVLSKLAKKQIKQKNSDVKVFSVNSPKDIAEIEEFING